MTTTSAVLPVNEGVTVSFTVTITDENGDALAVSSAEFGVRDAKTGTALFADKTVGSGITVGGAGSNVLTVTASAAEMADAPDFVDAQMWVILTASAAKHVVLDERGVSLKELWV